MDAILAEVAVHKKKPREAADPPGLLLGSAMLGTLRGDPQRHQNIMALRLQAVA
jgi:hypothetical protein